MADKRSIGLGVAAVAAAGAGVALAAKNHKQADERKSTQRRKESCEKDILHGFRVSKHGAWQI